MDYTTPSLFGVLALLGIMIYVRLGHLKKTSNQRCDPKVLDSKAHDVKMYAIMAKQIDHSTLRIKKEGHGLEFLKAVSSKKVDEIVLKGRSFAVTYKATMSKTFDVDINEANARSPFLKTSAPLADFVVSSDEFVMVYVMAH